ncbi:CoA pyrophosphatase [Aliidiomarina sanyensis]|uniref:CoA pyrophosphatase n=1 Tax=Aliidiomarina sanyensis TaxID=1249555 RepID=A0A432WNF3_9GAMM|nr:CoA pyrophosphatase [Aliidiomarina sanyensis]RUO35268.1 CoA pyrophosphatase [Aliidiomarina sanyensis]
MHREQFLQKFYLRPQPNVPWQSPEMQHGFRPSAVLVALQERDHGLDLILTRRSANLRFHAHQICFAGGRRDDEDPHLMATALREAEEEIGLRPDQVEVIATLPPQPVLTRYMIHPYLGFIAPDVQLAPEPGEVQEIVRVPLARVLQHEQHFIQPIDRAIYHELVFIPLDGQVIWGATAAIIRRLADHLYPERQALYRPVR